MSAKRKFNSDALEAIHSSALALFKVGAIDKATMRDFDERCLAVTPAMAPAAIKQLRESNKVSQPVLPATSTPAKARLRSGRPEPKSRAAPR